MLMAALRHLGFEVHPAASGREALDAMPTVRPDAVVLDVKVRGLTLGGDDYLVKPFSLEELVARVQAVLRRAGLAQADTVVRCADLEMDDDAHRVTRAGAEVNLSPTEYNLLRYLLVNQG